MTVDTPPDFVRALAYCLAYDRWQKPVDLTMLDRLLGGAEFHTEEEQLLDQMIQLARLVACGLREGNTLAERKDDLQRVHKAAQLLDDPKVALLMGGATKIKQYVFESAKLPEIRGASALLDRINLVDLPALFHWPCQEVDDNKRASAVRQQFLRRHSIAPPDCPDCVIYANGGELLAFAPVHLAPKLADEIEFLYTSATLVANSVAVWQPCSLTELAGGVAALTFWQHWEQESYQQRIAEVFGQRASKELPDKKRFGELAAALAGEKFRRREGNPGLDKDGTVCRPPKSVPHGETFAYGQRCRSCERRLASRKFSIAGEPQLVCEACHGKLRMGWKEKRGWVQRFETFLTQQGIADSYYQVMHKGSMQDVRSMCTKRRWDNHALPDRPQDLNEIGQAAEPQGYIGVVYADGNNMGALLERLQSPHAYQHFAEAVYKTTQHAVFQALASTLHPHRVEREGKQHKEHPWIHPFEILSIGGDDLFLIVPAHQALSIALQIAEEVEKCLAQDAQFRKEVSYEPPQVHRCALDRTHQIDTGTQSAIALSAGVLLCDAKTPIFFMQNLVEQLLKSAKKRAKELKQRYNYYGGTLDVMALKSVTMITSQVKEFRESALQVGKDRLTARPYTLLEMRQLLDSILMLKQLNFPRSQLYGLRKALWNGRLASTVDYLYFTERLGEQERLRLRQVLDQRWCHKGVAPWQSPTAGTPWETVLADMIELYDFVGKE